LPKVSACCWACYPMYQSNFGIYFFRFFCELGVWGIWMCVNLQRRIQDWKSMS
jgi:hypothetical protein